MKYPICYIYKKTSDRGRELRYSLRSLTNVKNWNGQVFVSGDTETWFSEKITVIDGFSRSADKFLDAKSKMRAITQDERVADDFLFFNDDFFIMEPIEITPLYDGKLESFTGHSQWRKQKSQTRDYLIAQGIPDPLNYAVHVPMLFNKQKLLDILDNPEIKKGLSIRSIYGNIYNIGGKEYKDRKSITSKLLQGEMLSTKMYTQELNKHFSSPSEFEV